MDTAHNMDTGAPIRWYMSLRFVLFMLNLLLALVFGSIAFTINQQKLEQPLASAAAAVLDLQQDKLLEQIRNQTDNASHFSQALNAVALSLWSKDRDLRSLGQRLLEQIPENSAIVAAGIWPEPRSFNNKRDRYSFYWTLDQGEVSFHGDYNDPSNISYHGERWYTPLRYFAGPSCHWSGRYTEPFLKKPVIACSTAVTIDGRFVGVTNLVIDPARLSASTSKKLSTTPFFLLLDGQQRVLSSDGIQVADNDNLASLAQRDSRFGPVAVHLHEKSESALKSAQKQDAEWPQKLAALSQSSRDLSKLEAAQILATIQQSGTREWGESLTINGNVLTQTSLRLDELGGIGTLLTGHYQSAKIAGLSLDFWISAATTAGAIALALLLSTLLSSRTTVTPLRKLIVQLRQPAEDTQLDESPANEIGMVASLFNNRHERIRMLLTSTRKATKQTNVAATAVSSNDDADMGWVIVDALSDSVVLTDMDGRIQYMNSAAEVLSGSNIPQAQNLSFDEVFHVL
ncbi:MAG: hypothetical protein ACSHXK_11975, partial [Oceanococcus sp.]